MPSEFQRAINAAFNNARESKNDDAPPPEKKTNTLEDFAETFVERTEMWVVGIGRGLLISIVPILLLGVTIAILVMIIRLPIEYIGGIN